MPKCPHARSFVIQNSRTGELGRMEVTCDSWRCEVCAERMRGAWKIHLSRYLPEGSELFKGHIHRNRWPAIYKWLNRQEADYVRFWDARANAYFVLATAEFCGSFSCAADVTESLIVKALKSISPTEGVNPISTSRPWKRRKPEPTGWVPVKSPQGRPLQASERDFCAVCLEYDVTPVRSPRGGFTLADVDKLSPHQILELCYKAAAKSRKSWWESVTYTTCSEDRGESDTGAEADLRYRAGPLSCRWDL